MIRKRGNDAAKPNWLLNPSHPPGAVDILHDYAFSKHSCLKVILMLYPYFVWCL